MRLVVDKLAVDRGGRRVLDGLSFGLSPSDGLIVRGPNGAGKSTLLRAIAGLLRPAEGTIRLEAPPRDAEIAEFVHYIGHGNGQRPGQTAAAAVTFWSAFLGGRPADPAPILAQLELAHLADVPAGTLSAGQKRRLAFARLMAVPRPLWLLDEPTVALDTRGQTIVERLIAQHLSSGGMAIVTTHTPLDVPLMRTLTLGAAGVVQ